MNTLATLLAAIALPSAEADVGFATRQMKFGAVEHDGAVGTVEAEAEWHGASFSAEWVYDGQGGRELTFGPGYSRTFGILEAGLEYLWERHPERIEEPTAFAVAELGVDTLLSPSVGAWVDTGRNAGAAYWTGDVRYDVPLAPGCTLETTGGLGIGNARRNEADANRGHFGPKDLHVCLCLDCPFCGALTLRPWVGATYRFIHDDGCGACVFCAGANICMRY